MTDRSKLAKSAPQTKASPLSPDELRKMNAYWRAANYLSVGQIYLLDNPLLKEPVRIEHVKPRLLGHWGTTPGLNFIYLHLNRVIKKQNLNMIYIIGPGHGGPGIVANCYLEGTYNEFYPDISQDAEGMKKLFKQFSFPGGIPSHVAPETPGSIHEGGELGYAVSHAFGAAFDNPDLIVACVVGDGEAETGPLAASWHSNKFLNPVHDGAVLPILHLNGYKIANPTLLARISHEELNNLFMGYGYKPYFVEGADPEAMHQLMAQTLDQVTAEIRAIQQEARAKGFSQRPEWPMIILRTPKGWTGPKEVDGKKTEDYWRSHQVPFSEMATAPGHIKLLEKWMKSYKPDVVMACAGDVPTLETLAAVDILRQNVPGLKIRVINVVDLMTLQPKEEHPHGLSDKEFNTLFTPDKPIIFAYHGYPWLIHRLTYRRTNHPHLHVRGYKEEGTTTTPFDMVVRNDLDRFHLVSDVIDRVPKLGSNAAYLKQHVRDRLIEHRQYIMKWGDDVPEIRDWKWPG